MAKGFTSGTRIEGIEKVVGELTGVRKGVKRKLLRAMRAEMKIEMKESMGRTPYKTGRLRASHRLVNVQEEGSELKVAIHVGDIEVDGVMVDYAVPVHEILGWEHPIGQAKFLESTLLESKAYMAERVARRMDLYK